MATTYNTAQIMPGSERLTLNAAGAVIQVSRKYFFFKDLAATIATRDDISGVTGLPVVGSAHPLYPSLYVQPYEITCGEGEERVKYVAAVTWAQAGAASGSGSGAGGDVKNVENNPPAGQAEISREYGYAQSETDLVCDQVTGEPVLNAAGDPFESVPQREVSDPVIRRTVRSNDAPSTYAALNNTVNDAAISVDGFAFPAHGALFRVSSRALWGDPDGYLFEHTFEITGRTNMIDADGDGTADTDIGWDFAFVQAGLNYYDNIGGVTTKVRATEVDASTGETKPSAAPVPLNANGTLNTTGVPVIKVVATYPEGSGSSMEACFPAVPRPVTTTTSGV